MSPNNEKNDDCASAALERRQLKISFAPTAEEQGQAAAPSASTEPGKVRGPYVSRSTCAPELSYRLISSSAPRFTALPPMTSTPESCQSTMKSPAMLSVRMTDSPAASVPYAERLTCPRSRVTSLKLQPVISTGVAPRLVNSMNSPPFPPGIYSVIRTLAPLGAGHMMLQFVPSPW